MSSADRLLLILHIGFTIFALGPLTAATSATPRYIRRGDARVLRYLSRATRIYGLLALVIFLSGLLLAHGKFSKVWLSASMTLFIVAFGLLLIVERDQRKALHKLELAAAGRPAPAEPSAAEGTAAAEAAAEAPAAEGAEKKTPEAEPAGPPAARPAGELARVETGRIATLSGVVALIWVVILVLMVWNAPS